MRLVAHLIASDVRRFRWLFLVWLLIEVTATTLNGIQPTYSATTRLFDLLGIVTIFSGWRSFCCCSSWSRWWYRRIRSWAPTRSG